MDMERQYVEEVLSGVKAVMPAVIIGEAEALCKKNGRTLRAVNEIRLRAVGRSSVVIDGMHLPLESQVDFEVLQAIFKRICDMAIFAHRDDIANGFVSMSGGCRVGVCGHAKYDGGKLVGVNSVSALVFRIPCGKCDFASELFEYWKKRNFCGMLICSPAGVGKTSAIRALVKLAGGKPYFKKVVAVDERCELDQRAYFDCTVDILRGYKRASGIEIAIRTMSAEIIVVDEIGNDLDSEALMLAVGAGVPVVATVHGDDIEKVMSKPFVRCLCDCGLFCSYAVITRRGQKRELLLGDF